MQGKVKWWMPKKGFGFAIGDDGREAYLNRRELLYATDLNEGDRIQYFVIEGENGKDLIAENIKLVSDRGNEILTKITSGEQQTLLMFFFCQIFQFAIFLYHPHNTFVNKIRKEKKYGSKSDGSSRNRKGPEE